VPEACFGRRESPFTTGTGGKSSGGPEREKSYRFGEEIIRAEDFSGSRESQTSKRICNKGRSLAGRERRKIGKIS